MEKPSTPAERASAFATIVGSKSSGEFLFTPDHEGGPANCGITVKRADGQSFEINQVFGIIEALDDQSRNLGGKRDGRFFPLAGGDEFPTAWYGRYQFSAELRLRQRISH